MRWLQWSMAHRKWLLKGRWDCALKTRCIILQRMTIMLCHILKIHWCFRTTVKSCQRWQNFWFQKIFSKENIVCDFGCLKQFCCIKYNVKKLSISKSEIKFHFKENKTLYFMLFLCLIFGFVIGFVLAFSSTNFVQLLTSSNKSLYAMINGTADYMGLLWKKFFGFAFPVVLLVVLNLTYYISLFGYLFITYQSALFILSCAAVIKTYSVSGVLNVVFLMIPINIVFFAVLFFAEVICLNRAKLAFKVKQFSYGYDSVFFLQIVICVAMLFLVSLFACVVYPMFLKNSIFLIFWFFT